MSKRNINAELSRYVGRYVENHNDEALTLAELGARAPLDGVYGSSRPRYERAAASLGMTPA